MVYEAYGDDDAWTTIRKADQEAAWQAVRRAASSTTTTATATAAWRRTSFAEQRERDMERNVRRVVAACRVTAATPAEVKAMLANGDDIAITGDGLKFVAAR